MSTMSRTRIPHDPRTILSVPPAPKFFHPHGIKMAVSDAKSNMGYRLIIESNAAELAITACGNCRWMVGTKVKNMHGEFATTRVYFSAEEFRQAFLTEDTRNEDEHLNAQRHDGDHGVQGTFIRSGFFLNIPGPGTGDDGDPNCSVYLSDETRKKLALFYERTCPSECHLGKKQ